MGVKKVGGGSVALGTTPWNRYDGNFKFYAMQYSLDWRWLKAIAIIESSLGRDERVAWGIKNPKDIEKSKSSDGKSWGLMQLTLQTARDFEPNTTIEDLNNPDTSVRLAAKFLAWIRDNNLNWDDRKIIMSYNQGVGNTKKGKTYAQGYWEKFVSALKTVKENP